LLAETATRRRDGPSFAAGLNRPMIFAANQT